MKIADLHERIRHYVLSTIESEHLTQQKLGEMSGVQQTHISNFLNGRRRLSVETMDSILGALGIDVSSLLNLPVVPQDFRAVSSPVHDVPLIRFSATMTPTFWDDEILGKCPFPTTLLQRLRTDETEQRRAWIRFLAVKADASLAAPMRPWLADGAILLVDRHYCSLNAYRKHRPNMYLIRLGEELSVRWVQLQGRQLCLRPERTDYPLEFVEISKQHSLRACIVGRVAHVGMEM